MEQSFTRVSVLLCGWAVLPSENRGEIRGPHTGSPPLGLPPPCSESVSPGESKLSRVVCVSATQGEASSSPCLSPLATCMSWPLSPCSTSPARSWTSESVNRNHQRVPKGLAGIAPARPSSPLRCCPGPPFPPHSSSLISSHGSPSQGRADGEPSPPSTGVAGTGHGTRPQAYLYHHFLFPAALATSRWDPLPGEAGGTPGRPANSGPSRVLAVARLQGLRWFRTPPGAPGLPLAQLPLVSFQKKGEEASILWAVDSPSQYVKPII